MATGGQTADTRKEVADGSLWDRAYNALQEEEPKRIAEYEELLSEALARGKSSVRPRLLSWTLT
jgi:hypothetical protein